MAKNIEFARFLAFYLKYSKNEGILMVAKDAEDLRTHLPRNRDRH